MEPRISIVIVSFNTRDLLRRCLASIGQIQSREVIVVDNDSADGSADMVDAEFQWVRLIRAAGNLGFARASNAGLRAGRGSFLLLLNPDTEVLDAAITEMAGFLQSHPRVGAVGPALLYADGAPQHSAFSFPTLWMSLLDLFPIHQRLLNSSLNGRYRIPNGGDPFRVDHPLGAAMMIRREALDDVGLLDEEYFMYCEEVDWSLRARKLGWEIYCVPSARVIHHSGQSTKQFKDKMLIELNRSRYRLFDKHYSRTFIRVHRLILRTWLARESARARRAARRGSMDGDELKRRLSTYRILWDM